MAISAITLAELSAGPNEVRGSSEQDMYDGHAEHARRLEILQRAESEFDPIPFGAEAARIFGRFTAAVVTADASHADESPACSSPQQPSPRDYRCSRRTPMTSPTWTLSCR
jgi:predicted nucleic acid-binding protein